jgi:two-component system, NarL family, response regulator DegU
MIQEVAPARLAIVDDHDFVRDGMKDMLSGIEDLEVIGEAADGQEAVDLIRRERPDLVLMDVRMPRLDGLEATRIIKRERPQTSVLMVTMHENPDYLLEALRAGAAGYVLKDATREDLVSAIRRVLSGESPLDPELAADLLRRLAEEAQEPAETRSPEADHPELLQPLTPRELEVLALLALGRTNREIAREFGVSRGTVKRHVENLIAKLGVSDRTQAVVRALELGIISFPKP